MSSSPPSTVRGSDSPPGRTFYQRNIEPILLQKCADGALDDSRFVPRRDDDRNERRLRRTCLGRKTRDQPKIEKRASERQDPENEDDGAEDVHVVSSCRFPVARGPETGNR